MNSYNINNLTTSEAAFAGGMVGTFLIATLVFCIFVIIALWKIFTKAGVKGWKSLIPIYNIYCFLKIVGLSPLWIIWMALAYIALFVTAAIVGNGQYIDWNTGQVPEVVATNGWFLLVAIIFFILSVYIGVLSAYRLAKVFGKGIGYTIGIILLPNIFTLILGFGSAKYDKKVLKNM